MTRTQALNCLYRLVKVERGATETSEDYDYFEGALITIGVDLDNVGSSGEDWQAAREYLQGSAS
jgi:hypothetical protein